MPWNAPHTWVNIVLGLVLLLMGRQLFWVYVAVLGFLYGFEISAVLYPVPSEASSWLIAAGGGLLGALVAVFLQPLAAGVAGFLAGGYAFLNLFSGPQWPIMEFSWVLFILGGAAGFLLVVLFFDWALIILSSLLGSALLLQSFGLDPAFRLPAIAALFIFGIIFQTRIPMPQQN